MFDESHGGTGQIIDADREYWRRRASRERNMARRARCRSARHAHDHLARLYASRGATRVSMEEETVWQTLRNRVERLWTNLQRAW